MKFNLNLVILLISINLSSQRALYVDNFNEILGNNNKETKLLNFVVENDFDKLILYELHKINKRLPLADTSYNYVLANFIKKAKNKFKIKEVAGSGENGGFFINNIHAYNQSRKNPLEKFDVYNLEYEYWHPTNSDLGGYYCETYLRKNGIPCTRKGSYNYYLETLSIMKLLASESNHKIIVEAYVGKYQKKEINNIVKNVDRVLVSAYGKNPYSSFLSIKKRLKLIAECKCKPEVSIILSAEKQYMNGHLKYNTLIKSENKFLNELEKIKNHKINRIGFTYFKYTVLERAVSYEKKRRLGKNYFPE